MPTRDTNCALEGRNVVPDRNRIGCRKASRHNGGKKIFLKEEKAALKQRG